MLFDISVGTNIYFLQINLNPKKITKLRTKNHTIQCKIYALTIFNQLRSTYYSCSIRDNSYVKLKEYSELEIDTNRFDMITLVYVSFSAVVYELGVCCGNSYKCTFSDILLEIEV